jgi:hypothetical protein
MLKDNIQRIQQIASLLSDDDPDKIEMMNIEGDYTSLLEWALRKQNEYVEYARAVADLAVIYNARENSFWEKSYSMRGLIEHIMIAANEKSFKGIAGSVSLSAKAPKPIIIDESLIPDQFKKVSYSIDKTKINEAVKNGETIPGVIMDNGGITLTIRTK